MPMGMARHGYDDGLGEILWMDLVQGTKYTAAPRYLLPSYDHDDDALLFHSIFIFPRRLIVR
jgi:hypothetical protein